MYKNDSGAWEYMEHMARLTIGFYLILDGYRQAIRSWLCGKINVHRLDAVRTHNTMFKQRKH